MGIEGSGPEAAIEFLVKNILGAAAVCGGSPSEAEVRSTVTAWVMAAPSSKSKKTTEPSA